MKILFCLLVVVNLFASTNLEKEKAFWDEIKDMDNISLFLEYKKLYPHGTFVPIANVKIKYLRSLDDGYSKTTTSKSKPSWTHGYTSKYKFYGVGKANKHFKGEDYQENLAKSRARRELQAKYDYYNLSNDTMWRYNELIKTEKYVDKRGRIYILLYIDNYDL